MLTFTKLRLSGFKSFVEGTDVLIEPGLTGIVGPNGCGKSNLVEALRWVMGETSAKQMRGGEMDDVIFGGTAGRPARNVAEVLIDLDNSKRTAAPPFESFDQLQISRRIERDKGSTYRVNGKEIRARDVQLLFADSATGARSTALMSQGQVGALIAAKPRERRVLLEEAAGISGLHSRRHEAELRLRAAATNLERVEDVLVALGAQIQSLKKQSRQAARFRTVSEQIRKTEALLFALRWQAVVEAVTTVNKCLGETRVAVADLTAHAGAAATQQAEVAARLPGLRRIEAEAAAVHQRLILTQERLDTEERRVVADQEACRTRLDQIVSDFDREQTLVGDAKQALLKLDRDKDRIEASRDGEQQARSKAEQALSAAAADVAGLDSRVTELTDAVAAAEAGRTALLRTIADQDKRLQRLAGRVGEIETQRKALAADAVGGDTIEQAESDLIGARDALERARAEADSAEQRRAETAERHTALLSVQRAAETGVTRLQAEADALAKLLATGASEDARPLIDSVKAAPGMESALAAALGDDLLASDEEMASARWRSLDDPPAPSQVLPEGVHTLADDVDSPPVLRRRLAQIGLVESDAAGDDLQHRLEPGQRLVTREGAMWRWDGYTVSAAASATAQRLERRNRLLELQQSLVIARVDLDKATAAAVEGKAAADAAVEAERQARSARAAADKAHDGIREKVADLRQRQAKNGSRVSALEETAAAIESERLEAEAARTAAQTELNAIEDPTSAREQLQALRADLAAARTRQAEHKATLDATIREAAARRRRLEAIAHETQSWSTRYEAAQRQLANLVDRRQATEGELRELEGRPETMAEQRAELLAQVEMAESRRREAADRLAEAEREQASADKNLRAAESALAEAREERVRAEAAVEQAEQARRDLAERIVEMLNTTPERLFEISGIEDAGTPPDTESIERRLEKLRREREMMGPVNLRAEQEAEELEGKIETLTTEREDLERAIAKLRRGIAELDKEGRERLMASFQDVDRHFRELFTRLFGGGRAHLALTDSDDPLDAGLEIMASPPGKRLQVLSLLSGGEQALATLALVFAVFLSNPAPICVLDEVDAPLDDANVDRFCDLVEHMAASSGTRFLIITHHRITMTRVDRLYGVTMSEKGVSQLVSVDLHQAEALRESA